MMLRPLHNVAWNLFLAVIPVLLSLLVFKGVRDQRRNGRVKWVMWIPTLIVWFAFLPNTCYLITEWRHYLDDLGRSPGLMDQARHNELILLEFLGMTGFYIGYSGFGLLCFFLAIYPLDILFNPSWVIRPLFFFLCSLGVYLGLVDRFNSWQLVRHPHEILHAAHQAVESPLVFVLMGFFALVLWLFYGIFGLTMDGVRMQYRKFRPISTGVYRNKHA
jgi:uncharacterized membrane protein